MDFIIGNTVRFGYNGETVEGTVESVKVVDGRKIAPENRGKTLVLVKVANGYKSCYVHKMEKAGSPA